VLVRAYALDISSDCVDDPNSSREWSYR
jgi:hypothetical protein